MDAFAIVLIAALAALALWVWVLGRHQQGASLEPFGLRSGRQIIEDRESLEAEDLAQMLEAHNARRRHRGEAEVTVTDLEAMVAQDVLELRRRGEAYRAEHMTDRGRGD